MPRASEATWAADEAELHRLLAEFKRVQGAHSSFVGNGGQLYNRIRVLQGRLGLQYPWKSPPAAPNHGLMEFR